MAASILSVATKSAESCWISWIFKLKMYFKLKIHSWNNFQLEDHLKRLKVFPTFKKNCLQLECIISKNEFSTWIQLEFNLNVPARWSNHVDLTWWLLSTSSMHSWFHLDRNFEEISNSDTLPIDKMPSLWILDEFSRRFPVRFWRVEMLPDFQVESSLQKLQFPWNLSSWNDLFHFLKFRGNFAWISQEIRPLPNSVAILIWQQLKLQRGLLGTTIWHLTDPRGSFSGKMTTRFSSWKFPEIFPGSGNPWSPLQVEVLNRSWNFWKISRIWDFHHETWKKMTGSSWDLKVQDLTCWFCERWRAICSTAKFRWDVDELPLQVV